MTMLGDGSRKFGFSRMGMGLEEARRRESEIADSKANVMNMKFMDRAARQAYRGSMRSGNYGQAYDIAKDATSRGLRVGGQIMRAGEREASVLAGDDEFRSSWGRTKQAGGRPAQSQSWDGDGDGTPDSIQTQGRNARGGLLPLQSKLESQLTSFSEQDAAARERSYASGAFGSNPIRKKEDSMESFTSDLAKSSLITNGDGAAQKRSLERGLRLGLSIDEVGMIGGFDAKSYSTFTNDPFAASYPTELSAMPANAALDVIPGKTAKAFKSKDVVSKTAAGIKSVTKAPFKLGAFLGKKVLKGQQKLLDKMNL